MSGPDTVEAIDRIEVELGRLGSPERGVGEKKYLKSDLVFIGVTMGDTRRVVSAFLKERPDTTHDEAIELAVGLWESPIFELRMVAVMVLQKLVDRLGAEDLEVVERFVRASKTWALVDPLAVDVAGQILLSDPGSESSIGRWARDEDFWVRRSALLAHLKGLRGGEELGRFATYADDMLEEKEFSIRKAIGWVLREAGKQRPQDVATWVGPRTHRASGVTMREAVKYLPEEDRARLMAAYRDRRPADEPGERGTPTTR